MYPHIPDEGAVGVVVPDVLQAMDVMHARLGQVEGVDDPAQSADGVRLVPVVVGALRCAIAV